MITSTEQIIIATVGSFVVAGLIILAAVATLAIGILIYKWGMSKLYSAAGYDYMQSYRNVNFDAVSRKILEIERRGD